MGFQLHFLNGSEILPKEELYQFFKEVHDNGQIIGEMGASFIALIPKEGAISIKDFCPISLIGNLYKILGKVLAN